MLRQRNVRTEEAGHQQEEGIFIGEQYGGAEYRPLASKESGAHRAWRALAGILLLLTGAQTHGAHRDGGVVVMD